MSQPSSSSPAFNPDLRAALVAMVRRRVPESEVEDIVQATLTEALESPHAPEDGESLRRWIFGVAKNKVVDYHRRAGRETFDLPDVPDAPAPHAEADLLRWAEEHLPEGDDAKKTLGWMLREGDGEKLESIAASEKLPAPRVRQRVSRLRRHFQDHWKREVAMLAALGVLVTIAVLLWVKKKDEPEIITGDPHALPIDPRADGIRRGALDRCAAGEHRRCLDGLDEARRLDPAGDARPEVQRARHDAEKALEPQPSPSPPTSTLPPLPPLPTSSAAPSDTVPRPDTTAAPPTSAPPFAPNPKKGTKPPSKTSDLGSFGASDFGGASDLGSSPNTPAQAASPPKPYAASKKGPASK